MMTNSRQSTVNAARKRTIWEWPQRARGRFARWRRERRMRWVPMNRLLLGGECGVDGAKFARLTGDLLRPSRSLHDSPHSVLIRQYQEMGEALFAPGVLENTPYYRNASVCIDIFGRYFDASRDEEIEGVARRFIGRLEERDPLRGERCRDQSGPYDPILVRPIAYSDCFQVVDGHHRLALACARGEDKALVMPLSQPVLTPLQSLLLDVLWLDGRRELYQPVEAPELKLQWVVVRRCTDRLAKMRDFLGEHDLVPPTLTSYVDLGSSYGWFVAEMSKLGFHSRGVERDPIAASVGPLVYGIRPEQIVRADIVRWLSTERTRFDVVSCLSVLHHFTLGRGSISAEEFIRLVDNRTSRVLFLDTGQGHETWFRDRLPEWNPDFIEVWLKKNTTFSTFHRLGNDEDAVAPFVGNYSRMLFACVR